MLLSLNTARLKFDVPCSFITELELLGEWQIIVLVSDKELLQEQLLMFRTSCGVFPALAEKRLICE